MYRQRVGMKCARRKRVGRCNLENAPVKQISFHGPDSPSIQLLITEIILTQLCREVFPIVSDCENMHVTNYLVRLAINFTEIVRKGV